MWDLSCLDWEDRIREGRSLLPDLDLNRDEAELAVEFYNEIQLPDVTGTPKLRTASGEWFRDIVRAVFGSWDEVNQERMIRDIFVLAPKGSSKTSYSAALMLVVLLMNRRPRAEALFLGPTQAIADRAYEAAVGMIEESPDLRRRFKPHQHEKTIEDLVNKSEIKVKTFDLKILTGSKGLIFVLIDELHLLGKDLKTAKVLRQIRGGLDKTPEGVLLITTTQSDDVPRGGFKSELKFARNVRDGLYRGKVMRPFLPMLFEFPREIAADPDQWQDPGNWPMVMPNINRPITVRELVADWSSEREKGTAAINVWASQHLNIEIGVGINNDGWRGADFWEAAGDETLTLDALLDRSEVVTMGVDGGGLDDLLGLAVVGREKGTRRWLVWCFAWANPKVLEVREEIASALHDFKQENSLAIVPVPEDHEQLGAIAEKVLLSGLLPEKNAIGLDPNNAAGVVSALKNAGVADEQIRRLKQGSGLSSGMYGLERKLSDNTLTHAGQLLMAWVVGNAKVEVARDGGKMITKQVSGSAKIDPLIALLQAVILMSWDPEARTTLDDFLSRPIMVV